MSEITIDGNPSEAGPSELTEAQIAKKAAKEAKKAAEKLRKAIYKEAYAVPKTEKIKVKKEEKVKEVKEEKGQAATTSTTSRSLGPIQTPIPIPKRISNTTNTQFKPISISGSTTSDDVLLLKTPSKRKRLSTEPDAKAKAKAGPSSTHTPLSRNSKTQQETNSKSNADASTSTNSNPNTNTEPGRGIKKLNKDKNKPVFTSLIPEHYSSTSSSLSPSTSRLPSLANAKTDVNHKTKVKGKGKQIAFKEDHGPGSDHDNDNDNDNNRSSSLSLSPLPPSSHSKTKTMPARSSSFGRTQKSLKRIRSSSSLTPTEESSSSMDEDEGSEYGHQPSKATPKGKGKGKRVSLGKGAGGGTENEYEPIGEKENKDSPRKSGRPKKVKSTLQSSQGEAGPSTPTTNKKKGSGKGKNTAPIVILPPSDFEFTPEPDSPVRPDRSPGKTQLDKEMAAHFKMMLEKRPVDYDPKIFHQPSSPLTRPSPSPPAPMDLNTASDHEACDDEEELQLVAKNRDVDEQCPICEDPLPMEPTSEFNILHDKYRAKPISSELEAATNFCNMHRDLIRTIPLGIHRGYPKSIDVTTIWESIVGTPWIQDRVRKLFQQPFGSTIFRNHCMSIMERGKDHWSRQKWTASMVAKASPGYYGTLGGQLIRQYLEELKTWGLLVIDDDNKYSPLSLTEFLLQVMVPEISIMLIMNDRFGWPNAPTQDSFDTIWDKANEVRSKSIDYGRYLATLQTDQETLDRYKFRPTKLAREQKSRELWKVRAVKAVKTGSGSGSKSKSKSKSRQVKRPTVNDIVNISTSPEPEPEPEPRSETINSSSQPIVYDSSPVPSDVPESETKLPSLDIPDSNRRSSTPLSSPDPSNAKRKSRKVTERPSNDVDSTEDGDAGIFAALDAMPDVDVDMSSDSQTRADLNVNANANAHTNLNGYGSVSVGPGRDRDRDRDVEPRSHGNSKTTPQEIRQSQDSFGDMEIGSQEMKVFEQVVRAHELEV